MNAGRRRGRRPDAGGEEGTWEMADVVHAAAPAAGPAPRRAYALVATGRATSALAGFIAVPVFTAYLDPAEYGAYALALACIYVANATLFHWTTAAVARMYPLHLQRPEVLLGAALRLWLVGALCSVAVVAVALISGLLEPGGRAVLLASWVALLGLSGYELLLEFARSGLRADTYAVAVGVCSLGSLGLGIGAAEAGMGSASPLVGLAGGSALAMGLLAARNRLQVAWPQVSMRRDTIARSMLSYGAPLGVALVMAMGLPAVDRILVARLVGDAELGVYAAAYGIVFPAVVFLGSVINITGFPRIMRAREAGDERDLQRHLKLQAASLVGVIVPAVVGAALLGPQLALVLPNRNYAASGALMPWIALAAALSVARAAYTDLRFHLSKATPWIAVCMAVALLVDASANAWLLPRISIKGAAYALCLAYAVALVLSIGLGAQRAALPLPSMSACVGTAGGVVTMVAAIALLPTARTAAGLIVCIAAAALCYTSGYLLAKRAVVSMAGVSQEVTRE